MSEQKETPAQEPTPEKGKRNFGNTIVLFIVFFIIFTVLVTGVAFFADKLKGGSKDKLTEEQQKENMTNPEGGKAEAYVMDDKGNLAKQAEAEAAKNEPAVEESPVLTAPVEPVKAEEPVKEPEPVEKPVVKKEEAKPVVKEAPKVEVKKEVVKPAVKVETPKAVQKPVEKPAEKPVVKKEETKPVVKETPKVVAPVENKITPVIPGDYMVQLASFKNFELAEEEYRRLRSKISDLQLVKVDLGEKGIWYRLRCSTGLSKESAKARAAQIAATTNYQPDVVHK